MTYQTTTQTHDYDTVEEASSLLTSVTGSPAPSFPFGQGGGGGGGVSARKKKNRVPSTRALIVTCLLLGTIAVIYYGGSGSSNTNFQRADDTSEALLLRHNQAAPYYDPNQDYCFMEQYGFGRYCWYPTEDYIHPVGTWKAVTGRGFDSCGPECPAPPPTPPRTTPVYDPRQDYCFMDTDTAGKYCWYATDYWLPYGNWVKDGAHVYNDCGPECATPPTPSPTPSPVSDPSKYDPRQDYCFMNTNTAGKYCWYATDYWLPSGNWVKDGAHIYNDCGPECPAPPPTPPPNPQVYDPKQNYCFKATHVDFDQYCWYHKDDFPVGNWEGKGGRGYNDCGQKCTEVYMYDPSRDTCFKDKVNDGKYCWWVAHRQVPHPYAQWEEVTGAGIDNCGAECTELMDPRGGEY